ncbi:MAG: BatD family protein, partial [Gammaproteobacteria bacterium]|nr:BatD family protein [Gammaproteobacteria bacterium]
MHIFACLAIAMLAAGTVYGELRATITPRIADEMETVRLTLRAPDARRTEKLDLTALEDDFEVLGTQTSSEYRSINGRVEAFVEYQINLRPKRSGELTIPSIDIGGESSRPLRLTVRSLDPGVKQAIEKMVFFETDVSPNPVYVQAQTVLTRQLFYSNGVQIYSDLPGTPEVPDAVVVPLGDTRSLNVFRDGQRYGVIEQRFAIYPESSGTLVIPAIAVTSSVRVQSGDRIRRSGVRIGTDELSVDVLPIPPGYPLDQPWLPATNIRLNDTWTPATTSYEIGDPVSRAIIVLVTDNVGSAIPPLGVTLPESNFRLYPETPILDDDSSGDTVIGARLENFSIIPTHPGKAYIPPIEVTWWDTDNEQVRVSELPGISVDISGDITADSAAPAPPPPLETTTPASSEITAEPVSQPQPSSIEDILTNKLTWWLAGILLFTSAGWLITLWKIRSGFTFLPKRSSTRANSWPRLKRACKGDDLHEIR